MFSSSSLGAVYEGGVVTVVLLTAAAAIPATIIHWQAVSSLPGRVKPSITAGANSIAAAPADSDTDSAKTLLKNLGVSPCRRFHKLSSVDMVIIF